MMTQGVLGFQYEGVGSAAGMTSLGGLPVYLELVRASGMVDAIRQPARAAGEQGWLYAQMVLALVFLNLAGGDCVEDIERLEADGGLVAVLGGIERELLSRAERRRLKKRWRRERTLPSPAAILEWLERYHDPAAEDQREIGTAFIP